MTNPPPPHCLCVRYQLLLQLMCPHTIVGINLILSLSLGVYFKLNLLTEKVGEA